MHPPAHHDQSPGVILTFKVWLLEVLKLPFSGTFLLTSAGRTGMYSKLQPSTVRVAQDMFDRIEAVTYMWCLYFIPAAALCIRNLITYWIS
uniref:Uncharacterized protein n=1 Tax=Pyxicephalus adspersus TaxID=30357 RepID=A0AAV3AGJ2_PYXAD|nr:TPA: hypothetical protein GDO54_006449 [Pyxicephalus adspersus]